MKTSRAHREPTPERVAPPVDYRATLIQKLDEIRIAHGAVHENKARHAFAEALLYLINRATPPEPQAAKTFHVSPYDPDR